MPSASLPVAAVLDRNTLQSQGCSSCFRALTVRGHQCQHWSWELRSPGAIPAVLNLSTTIAVSLSCLADQSVQDFMRTGDEAVTDSSQGTVVQLGCSLFVDAGVQLSPDFAERAASWANSSLLQTNFTNPNTTHIQEWITTHHAGTVGTHRNGCTWMKCKIGVMGEIAFKQA